MKGRIAPLLVMLVLVGTTAFGVEPDEILADPAMEARAREVSKELRCLVCRNENIDDSDAPLARDLRILLRARISAGDTDDEAVSYIVDRYGEYVLLSPRAQGSALILWLAGPFALLLGGGLAAVFLRRREKTPTPDSLSDEEEARLAAILSKEP